MIGDVTQAADLPRVLSSYPSIPGQSLIDILTSRVELEPFNAIATGIFFLAILHTFASARFTALAHSVQHRHDDEARAGGRPVTPSIAAELLHFLGEIEVVFGLWAVILLLAITGYAGWEQATHYINSSVNYTEPMFVVVIMALASTRPVITFAEAALRKVADAGGGTPAAWWFTILTIGPILGSFVTEPAAMTISALLLGRQFYDLRPSTRLKYGTLGLLFVNISIGGTLTHFAAPPVLMVAREWGWDTGFMITHFGWRAIIAILVSTIVYFLFFGRELRGMAARRPVPDDDTGEEPVNGAVQLSVPLWVTGVHLSFMGWTVLTAHYPALFLGGFLFFLGFARATPAYQGRFELRTPLLVGFFLAGLVIHGGMQGWWISPVLGSLAEEPLFFGAALLTAFNDNALITFLATLVPDLSDPLKYAVVEGAVVGGGLTVIAKCAEPGRAGAAQSIL